MPITTGRPGKSENEKIVLQAYSANTITMVKTYLHSFHQQQLQ